MGLLDALGLGKAAKDEPSALYGVDFMPDVLEGLSDMSIGELFRAQPHLRTVTTFIARMVATVSLHAYERQDDGGRLRVRDTWLSEVIDKPNPHESMYDFLYNSVMDLCLHDECIWHLSSANDRPDRFHLYRIPPHWVINTKWKDPWTLSALAIRDSITGEKVWLDGADLIRLHGYSPASTKYGMSPIEALKDTLREQLESSSYRAQLWKNGPRLGGIITRPAGVKWDDTSRRRFKASWKAQYSGRGSGAGGVPVLEDGMTFQAFHLSAKDEMLPEMVKLSLSTVAQVYHINPTMVGLLDNANYSNVREFRQSLYGDSLGPLMKQIEAAINSFLLPMLKAREGDFDPARVYVEFNVEERLRGRFEEQAQVTSTAVGGPWMTRNEARAMNNLPAVDGGDELIIPLNTTTNAPGDGEDTVPASEDPAENSPDPGDPAGRGDQ